MNQSVWWNFIRVLNVAQVSLHPTKKLLTEFLPETPNLHKGLGLWLDSGSCSFKLISTKERANKSLLVLRFLPLHGKHETCRGPSGTNGTFSEPLPSVQPFKLLLFIGPAPAQQLRKAGWESGLWITAPKKNKIWKPKKNMGDLENDVLIILILFKLNWLFEFKHLTLAAPIGPFQTKKRQLWAQIMRTWGPASEVSLHQVMKRLWSHVMAPGLEKHHDSVHQAEPRSCWPPTIHGLCLPTKRSGVRDVGISGYHTTSAILNLVYSTYYMKMESEWERSSNPCMEIWKQPLNKACIHGQRWCIFWDKQLSLSLAFQDFWHFKLSPWHLRLTRGFVWHLGLTRVSLASNTPQTPQILWTFPMFTGIILLDIWETYTFNFQQSFFSYEWGPNCFWTNDPILISPTPRDVRFTTDLASNKGKYLTALKATKLQGCLLIKTLQMPTHLSSDGNFLPTSFDHTHRTRAMWNRKKIFGGIWAKAAHHMKVCKTKPSPK